jgi:hypothetical protein
MTSDPLLLLLDWHFCLEQSKWGLGAPMREVQRLWLLVARRIPSDGSLDGVTAA